MNLSIITPTLNCGPTLRATIESVRPLVEAGAEHIVVDSGSVDETLALAESAGARILTAPRGNLYTAVNTGIRQSDREWVTYLNGDDIIFADAVLSATVGLESNEMVVYGNIDYIDSVGRFLFSWRSPRAELLYFLMAYYNPFPQQGTLFRRSLFDQLGGFDTRFRYSADYDFWCRAQIGGVKFRKSGSLSHAAFRLSPTQLSQSQRNVMAPEGFEIRCKVQEKRSATVLGRQLASLYRWSTNLDSYVLRSWRGRQLDRGWR